MENDDGEVVKETWEASNSLIKKTHLSKCDLTLKLLLKKYEDTFV